MGTATTMKNSPLQIGDVLEIQTPTGLAYIQYTHDFGSDGQLVRILPGLYPTPVTDISSLAAGEELYYVYYPLKIAVKKKDARFVSRQPVPTSSQEPPLLRWEGPRDRSGKVVGWKVFKASDPLTLTVHARTPLLTELTPEQQKLSIHQMWPHPVLVNQLSRGWRPERAEEFRLADQIGRTETSGAVSSTGANCAGGVRHYLYFPTEASAAAACTQLGGVGIAADSRPGADGTNWLVIGSHPLEMADETTGALHALLEGLAKKLGGEYDGWDTRL